MRRLILFLVLAVAVIVGLNVVSRVFDDRRQIDAMNALLADTSGRDAIIVGSSVGGAIRFDTLCTDGADFFFVLQDIFETQAMVELVLSRPDPPRQWFLALSPGAPQYNNAIAASARTHNRRLTYRFLFDNDRNGLIGGDWRQYAVTRISPALGYDDWRKRFQAMLAATGLRPPAEPLETLIWRLDGSMDPAREEDLAAIQVADRIADIQAIAYYDPHVPDRSAAAIRQINARIQASGGQLFVIVPPASPRMLALSRRSLASELDVLWQALDQVEGEGAVVINAWRNPARDYPVDMFVDPNHLNPEGARAFSTDLAEGLRSRGYPVADTCSR